ncbi:MAG TPA: hypothetical protein VEZ90_17275 [Blastocatellia bacterium]|nr:hypothetical protein [Blastocatellia bacterium]
MRYKTGFTLLLSLFAIPAFSAARPVFAQNGPDARLDRMKKLDFLAGNWKGMGWVEIIPGNRIDLSGSEIVHCQLGGRVVQIEGAHTNGAPAGSTGNAALKPISNQPVEIRDFVLISYDPKSDGYTVRLYKPDGSFVDGHAVLSGPNTVAWQNKQAAHLNVRLTINVDQNGEWSQTREFTTDGRNWKTYFKMILMKTEGD